MTTTSIPPTPAAPPSPLETTLLQTLAQLPPDQQHAVLYFAQFLASHYGHNLGDNQAVVATEDVAETADPELEFSADRFEESFSQALAGQTLPLADLWEELGDE